MRVVVALGGNALLERGETADSDIQETHVVSAVTAPEPSHPIPFGAHRSPLRMVVQSCMGSREPG